MDTLSHSEITEFNEIAAEFGAEPLGHNDSDSKDIADFDMLIDQLEASLDTTQQMIEARSPQNPDEDLRKSVHTLALRLEEIANELAVINSKLS